jgi:hypothetical protein
MMRLSTVLAFVVLVAQANCLTDCAACETIETSSQLSVHFAESQDVHDEYCNTCGHSTIRATWRFDSPPTEGTVVVSVRFSCAGDFGRFHTYNVPRVFQLGATEAVFDEVGVKNVCGENKNIFLLVRVSNNTNQPLTVDGTITCPKSISTGAGPSAVGQRRGSAP